MRKILFLGNGNHFFLSNLSREIVKKGFETAILSTQKLTEENESVYSLGQIMVNESVIKVPQYIPFRGMVVEMIKLLSGLNMIKNNYDIVNIHFAYYYYGLIIKSIKRKGDRVVVSIWGSDLLKNKSRLKTLALKRLLQKCDAISVSNEELIPVLLDKFGLELDEKIFISKFGLPVIDIFQSSNFSKKDCRELFGVPEDAYVVTVGYNGSRIQQHIQVINSIQKVIKILPDNLFLVFPFTYGGTVEYRNKVFRCVKELDVPFVFVDSYLKTDEVACLRMASDVMIQVQKTDQLSGSMTEYLAANNVVFTGSWLPYQFFDNLGISFIRVGDVNEIGGRLVETVNGSFNIDLQNNRDIILNYFGWKYRVFDWVKLFS